MIIFIFFMGGMLWTDWYANQLLSFKLTPESINKPLLIEGSIVSLPVTTQFGVRFDFAMTHTKMRLIIPFTVIKKDATLSHLAPGQHWQFNVKLKPIHAIQNMGTFDYEAWAMAHGIRAEGHVLKSKYNNLLSDHWYHEPLNRFRFLLKKNITSLLPRSSSSPWLLALTLGEHEHIIASDWDVLRNTGTNHLMAIAGLHIGLIAGFTRIITEFFLKRFPGLLLHFPLTILSSLPALIVAIAYSALSGFSLPTKRACIMLFIAFLAFVLRRKINSFHILFCALFIVLVINPLDVLTDSFWLSFTTIALIIYGMHARYDTHSFWWKWGRVQWVIGLGLIPLSLTLFSSCSVISFIANTIAVPVLGFFILPLCFFGLLVMGLFPKLTQFLFAIADKELSWLFHFLTCLSDLSFATWSFAMPHLIYIFIATVIVFILLLPFRTPGFYFAFFLMLPFFFIKHPRPQKNELWLTILDVGQGLAVVMQTTHHQLIYDTGGKFYTGNDMGKSVLIPFFRNQGIKKVSKVIISHGDSDHIGGLASISDVVAIKHIITSYPKLESHSPITLCDAGLYWQWDGVSFRVLSPKTITSYQGNNSSCVLLVSVGTHHILLPGDIEKKAQREIMAHVPQMPPIDILIAPHHGSKSSLHHNFIKMVKPQYVIYATGYQNRYHLPHPKVVSAYLDVQAIGLNTADTGEITFRIKENQMMEIPKRYREYHHRYWYHPS